MWQIAVYLVSASYIILARKKILVAECNGHIRTVNIEGPTWLERRCERERQSKDGKKEQ